MMKSFRFTPFSQTTVMFPKSNPFLCNRKLVITEEVERINRHQNEIRAERSENEAVYWRMQMDLMKEHGINKVVLFSKKKLAGVFQNRHDAIEKKMELEDSGAFITQIGGDRTMPTVLAKDPLSNYHSNAYVTPGDVPPHLFEAAVPESNFQIRTFYHTGPSQRPYVVLPLKKERVAKTVIPTTFLIDTGSPSTFLESNTLEALGLEPLNQSTYEVFVFGKPRDAFFSNNHFSNINLLGTDWIYWYDLHVCNPKLEFCVRKKKGDK